MKKTKIVATLGPSCDGDGVLLKMIQAGVNVFRLNFSHGKHKDHARRVLAARHCAKILGTPITILQDISGPKIRIGELEPRVVELRTGDQLTLTTRSVSGNKSLASVNYAGLPSDVKPKDVLLLADGTIEVEVTSVNNEVVETRILNGGRLSSHQGINFPGGHLTMASITAKDEEDLRFGGSLGVDLVALSFVRKAKDIEQARRLLRKLGAKPLPLIAKIEMREAVEALDGILSAADGAMVARGDLGVEIPLEQVPLTQKRIIQKCRYLGKPCIVATHLLASMVSRPRPTRAEVSDITTAVLDGADALMLSEETAVGSYPIESVRMMAKIAKTAEESINYRRLLTDTLISDSVSDAISQAACMMASDLNAKAILTPTAKGSTAKRVARFRPAQPVLALSHREDTLKFLNLYWGVVPLRIAPAKSLDGLFAICTQAALRRGAVKKNDTVVITAGVPLNKAGSTNLIKVQRIGPTK